MNLSLPFTKSTTKDKKHCKLTRTKLMGDKKIAFENDAHYITKHNKKIKLNSSYPQGIREGKASEKQINSCCRMGLGL